MTTRTAPLTPEQVGGALTYEGFLARARPDLRERFEAHASEVRLSEEDLEPFRMASRRTGGPAQVVLFGEDWCPDVQRALPLLRRVADAAGWRLGVLGRDEGLEVLAQFPGRGGVPRIPTVFFLDKEVRLLGAWIERPALAHQEIAAYQERVPERQRDMGAFHWESRTGWRRATLEEWRVLLSA